MCKLAVYTGSFFKMYLVFNYYHNLLSCKILTSQKPGLKLAKKKLQEPPKPSNEEVLLTEIEIYLKSETIEG